MKFLGTGHKGIIQNGMNPAEKLTLVYMALTAVVLLAGAGHIEGEAGALAVRLTMTLVIFFTVWLNNRMPGRSVEILRKFYLLPLLGYWYGETDLMNNLFFSYLDPYLISAEMKIFGMQPSMAFSEAVNSRLWAEIFYFAYFSFYVMIFVLCAATAFMNPSSYNTMLFVLLSSFYGFYLLFIFFPTEGPCFWYALAPSDLPGGYFFEKAVKWAQETGDKPTGAFPSSHVGMALIMLILAWKYCRRIFFWMLPVALLLMLSTVYIKAHYAIDVCGGLVFGALIYFISQKLNSIFKSRQNPG